MRHAFTIPAEPVENEQHIPILVEKHVRQTFQTTDTDFTWWLQALRESYIPRKKHNKTKQQQEFYWHALVRHHFHLSSGFETRSNTNQAVQTQRMGRGLKLDLGSRGTVLSMSRKLSR